MAAQRWEGSFGAGSSGNLKLAVFVLGPYPNSGAAKQAVAAGAQTEIAYDGGRYMVYAEKQSYLSSSVSLVAACLSQPTGSGYSF